MSQLERIVDAIRNSQILRLCLIAGLAVVLLVPIVMIWGLVSERQDRNREATAEVSSKWGNTQTIIGPALILPYMARWTETTPSGEVTRTGVRNAVFLPKELRTTGRVDVESRSRGIFKVPVYGMKISVAGEFGKPNLAELGIDPTSIAWDRAHVAVGISDVRAIREQTAISWNGREAEFLPGVGGFADGRSGIHALVTAGAADSEFRFSFPLSLNGSLAIYFVPFAETTSVQLTSNSPNPDFQGSWLPADRAISQNGFDATWRISYLGRNYSQSWISGAIPGKAIDDSRFGVQLIEPIDRYRMAERSVKYAGLFILLTFAFVWLIEVMAGTRVHPIQYLMLGAALCVFYLLELSLSERLNFSLAYGIASLAILGLVAAYSRVIFKRGQRAVLVACGVAGLYGYLFVLLTNEDAALLFGSIGLFVILGAIMFVTRRVDWYFREKSMPNS
jgi:inner membrane protein